jgi:hypothetical protein
MSRVFLSNFDFEERLTAPGATRSAEASRRNARLAYSWLSIARPGDVILAEQPPSSAFLAFLQQAGLGEVRFLASVAAANALFATPWGWDRDVLAWAERHGCPCDAPPLEVVSEVNRRRFSFELERSWGVGIEGQVPCDSVAAVRRAIGSLDRWLIKADLSAAGRQRLSHRGSALSVDQERWVERRLNRDGAVFVEPVVERLDEAGFQWNVPPQGMGPPELVGIVPLRVDAQGQYAGSVIDSREPVAAHWSEALDVSRLAAEKVQQSGYFGPLGIDAMHYSDSQHVARVRPLQDINARWTMGRLALGLHEVLQSPVHPASDRGGNSDCSRLTGDACLTLAEGGVLDPHRRWIEIAHAVG